MLILSRKLNESIVIGDSITIRILRIGRDTVKVGIQAPSECRVYREEVSGLTEEEKRVLKEANQAVSNRRSASGDAGSGPK